MKPADSEADEHFPPEVILIKRLEHEIRTQLEESNTQQQVDPAVLAKCIFCTYDTGTDKPIIF